MKAKTVKFERNMNPKDSMEIGMWKDYEEGVLVTIEKFRLNGGEIEKGREIYNPSGFLAGYWYDYDTTQEIDLISINKISDTNIRAAGFQYMVKIPAKVMYI